MNISIKILFFAICLIFFNKLSAQDELVPAAHDLWKTGLSKARKGDYRGSIADFLAAEELYREELGDNHALVGKMYIYLGDVSRRGGKYSLAFDYYTKAEDIFLLNKDEDNLRYIIPLFNSLGLHYNYYKNFDKSLAFFFEVITLTKNKYGPTHFQIGYTYTNIGNVYSKMGDLESALEYYRYAKDILEVVFADRKNQLSKLYNNYGAELMKSKQYEEAKTYFQQAIEVQEAVGKTSPLLAEGYNHLGFVLIAKNKEKEAIAHFETVFEILGLENLGKENFGNVNSPEQCLIALSGISQAYNKHYESTKNEASLTEGKKMVSLALDYVHYLKTDFGETGAQQILMRHSFPVFEQAIAIALNGNNGSKGNFIDAFKLSEQSRNNFMREAFQEQNAKEFAGIPDSLLLKENEIKENLSKIEKKKFDEEKGTNDPIKVNKLQQEILAQKKTYYELISKFEKDFPEYYSLKYSTDVITVPEVQETVLKKNQSLLEYFVGDHYIFAFIITKTNYQIIKIKKDFPLDVSVERMREGIFQWRPRDKENAKINLENYTENALFLFEKLIAPVEKYLTDDVIIVPGDILGYLPFEALLSEKVEENTRFLDYPYWIKEKQISYNYSATLFREMLKERNTGREVLAIAPKFNNISSDILPYDLPDLGSLKYNEKEVDAIKNLLGGLALKGENATLQSFKEIAPLYKILHLATHGKANDDENKFSYLAFSYILDSLDNELLYARDLYNMKLRADLIVLSACETGIGELQRGEGIMSLARGFSYAGAKSIVNTLWSIDDKASLDIMVNFYKNLEDGDRKDKALRNAKLSYISNNSDTRAHPFFWAAYVPIGNMESIAIGRQYNSLLLGTLLLIAILLLVLYWYLKKRSK